MVHAPFSLFKRPRKDGSVWWWARFWDYKRRRFAESHPLDIEFEGKKRDLVAATSKATKMLESISFDVADSYFVSWVIQFWTPGISKYLRLKELGQGEPLSTEYITNNRRGLELYAKTYPGFRRLKVFELKSADLQDWQLWMIEQGIGRRRINQILQSVRVPLRWAQRRQQIPNNPAKGVDPIKVNQKEKGVLTLAEVNRLLLAKDIDTRATLAVALACLGGLRRGEVRGLKWRSVDIDNRWIHVEENYVDGEGSKKPKANSLRIVPMHTALIPLFQQLHFQTQYKNPDDFVIFETYGHRSKAVSCEFFRSSFKRLLCEIGITAEEQVERNLTYHSLRHTFVTLARGAELPDVVVQALSGHKTKQMLDHYSHIIQTMRPAEIMAKLDNYLMASMDEKKDETKLSTTDALATTGI